MSATLMSGDRRAETGVLNPFWSPDARLRGRSVELAGRPRGSNYHQVDIGSGLGPPSLPFLR
jgi:hypothetical protein